MTRMADRCGLCGEAVRVEDDDAVLVHGGALMHESCLAEGDDVESSTAEIERERRERAKRRARERHKAG
jgi:hypothetical protein